MAAPRRRQAPGYKPNKPITPQQLARLLRIKANTYSVYVDFKFGYRNKEDVSTLPPNVLVVGSQNVLTNAADRVAARQGYVLDGPAANPANLYKIDSAYDFISQSNNIQNLRKWNTNLEVRYSNPVTKAISWVSLLSTLGATKGVNFTSFWDANTELKKQCLFVNGDNNIYEWSGGVGSVASVTSNTIVLSGSLTTDQLGFYSNAGNSAKFKLLIGGVIYTYTGVSGQTFTGVTPDPTAASPAIAAGDPVVQLPASTAGSSITSGPGASYNFDLIATLGNQIWYASNTSSNIYVSKTNNYKDCSFSSVRLAGEGALLVSDSFPNAFKPQGLQMYISAGTDEWWVSTRSKQNISVNNVAVATELLYISRLNTANNQAAQSQAAVGHFKNSIMYVSKEPIFNTLGLVKNIYADPQITNISDAIKYDMDAYDFTDCSVFYFNYFIYISVPKESIVRIFNVQKKYWEAPQLLPISRFYVVDGELYGHSYLVPESYKLFTGYNDNGNPINCIAAFAYDNMSGGKHQALRPVKKNFNQYYTEGYITSNTKLTLTINYDFGGFTSQQSNVISGTDKKIIFNSVGDGSLGKQPLGEYPIGSIFNAPSNIPKFRKLTTMVRQNYYEYQPVFSSNDVDQQWEVLALGPAQSMASELPVEISE